MANQRKEGKKMAGAYVWENDLDNIKRLAAKNNVSVSDMIKALISDLDDMEEKALKRIVNKAKDQQ